MDPNSKFDYPFAAQSTISDFSKRAEAYAVRNFGITLTVEKLPKKLGGGEIVSMPDKKVIEHVLNLYGLMGEAKERSITLPFSCNGVKISSKTNFFICSYKVNDRKAICPNKKKPLYPEGLSALIIMPPVESYSDDSSRTSNSSDDQSYSFSTCQSTSTFDDVSLIYDYDDDDDTSTSSNNSSSSSCSSSSDDSSSTTSSN